MVEEPDAYRGKEKNYTPPEVSRSNDPLCLHERKPLTDEEIFANIDM